MKNNSPYRLASRVEIESAQAALLALKMLLKSAYGAKVGENSDYVAEALRKTLDSTSATMGSMYTDVWNPQASYIVREYEKLSRHAGETMDFLCGKAAYRGPTRGKMTAEERTKYIRSNGEKSYLELPL